MAGGLQGLRDPLTLGAGLQQDPHRTVAAERLDQPRRGGRHALLSEDRAVGVDNANLAIPHVQIDGTIDHGWLLLLECPVSAGRNSVCGAQATTLGSSQPLHLISVVRKENGGAEGTDQASQRSAGATERSSTFRTHLRSPVPPV